MSDASLLEAPVTIDTPPDENRHYFKKADLDRNLMEGAAIKALCGFIKEGLAHTDIDAPVCESCKLIYENDCP